MVKIRLSKYGSKGNVTYRIIAINEKRKREGRALDILGFWQPSKSIKKIDKQKLENWLKKGAKVTPGVKKLLDGKDSK